MAVQRARPILLNERFLVIGASAIDRAHVRGAALANTWCSNKHCYNYIQINIIIIIQTCTCAGSKIQRWPARTTRFAMIDDHA